MFLPTQARFFPMRVPPLGPRPMPMASAAGGYRTVTDPQTGQICRLNPAQAAALDAGSCTGCRCMLVGDVNRSPARQYGWTGAIEQPSSQSGNFVISNGAPAPAVSSSPIAVQANAPSTSSPASSPAASDVATVSAPAAGATPPAPASSIFSFFTGTPWIGSIPNWMLLAGAGVGVALMATGTHR